MTNKILRLVIGGLLFLLWIAASWHGAVSGDRMSLAVFFCGSIIIGLSGFIEPQGNGVSWTVLIFTLVYYTVEGIDNVFLGGTYFSTYNFEKGFADGLGMILILLSFLAAKKSNPKEESGA